VGDMRWVSVLTLVSVAALGADRVATVRAKRMDDVRALVEKAGLKYPVAEVYVRVLKAEREVELWAAGKPGGQMVLIKTYAICAASGDLGPKRKEGDLQVPEGLYEFSDFNAWSDYHLSLKVSYPNSSDRVRSDARRPGGLIYMHGKCVSIGCVAIEDAQIEEVYLISFDALKKPSRVDLFPARLSKEWLAGAPETHREFWSELLPAFESFETRHRPARFSVEKETGRYVVRP
jgi:murein L,D-transpeptidase YafK